MVNTVKNFYICRYNKNYNMPYSGKQAAACYAKKHACEKRGMKSAWNCKDDMKKPRGRKVKITDNGYTTYCIDTRSRSRSTKSGSRSRSRSLSSHTVAELKAIC